MRMRSKADEVKCGCGQIRLKCNQSADVECGNGRIRFSIKRLKAIDRITLNADVNANAFDGFVVVAAVF